LPAQQHIVGMLMGCSQHMARMLAPPYRQLSN
jgi:hypothetical protein